MGQGARAALWAAGLHPEKTIGTAKEACAASAATGQRWVEVGPESDPQGSPEVAWSEGEACVAGQAARDVAWGAWVRDVSWVMTGVGVEAQEEQPES